MGRYRRYEKYGKYGKYGSTGWGLVSWLALAVVLYGVVSVGIGLGTADRCGAIGADKRWNFVPPHWVCV